LRTALSRDLIRHLDCFNYNIVARRAPPVSTIPLILKLYKNSAEIWFW